MEKMKKLFLYSIVTLFGVFCVSSCVQPLEPGLKEKAGDHQLSFSVSCTTPSTKADDTYPAGENLYNENRIDYVDWFIFRDTTSGTAWQSGRETLNNADGAAAEFVVRSGIDMDQYVSSYSDGKGYVFVVANYPGAEGHALFDGKTYAQIREMSFVTSELNDMIQNKFKALPNFVMTSGAEKFELSGENKSVTVHAKLFRQISKLTLNISIVPYIDEMKAHVSGLDTTQLDYVQTWYPDVAGIRAYMMYADKASTLTPVATDTDLEDIPIYNDETEPNFFSYYSRGYIPTIAINADHSATVTGTPFYSYPMRWSTSDAHAPFIKIILKWKPVVESTEEAQTEVYNHTIGGKTSIPSFRVTTRNFPTNMSGSENFYYKITIPTDKTAPNRLRSNVWTKVTLDVAILGGIEAESSVELAGRYYVVNWSDPRVTGGGNLTSGKYLSLAAPRDTFYMYGVDSLEIPVKSSHPLSASITKREVYINGDWTTESTKPANLSSRGNFRFAADGRSFIKFGDALNNEMGENLDCYPMRFTLDLRHTAGSGGLTTTQRIVVLQYPSIYIEQKDGGPSFVNGYYGNVNGYFHDIDGSTGPSGTSTGSSIENSTNTGYGRIAKYDDDYTKLTVISISAFSNNSKSYTVSYNGTEITRNYLIADPREPAGYSSSDLNPYYKDNDNDTHEWGSYAAKIQKGTMEPNFIAPKLMVASTWGRQRYGNTDYENTLKRCATYQEAGYPAGRWRLPTEAEVVFIMNLQKYHILEKNLFNRNNDVWNWISNGSSINLQTDYNIRVETNHTGNNTSRCVYDLWYWEDKPVSDPTVYTIGVN